MPLKEAWNLLTADLPDGAKQRLMIFLMALLLVFHVAWACGWIPGISGFAMAQDTEEIVDDVKQLKQTLQESNQEIRELLEEGLTDLKRSQLEGQISGLHTLRCAAESPVLRQEYANQIQRLQARYWRLTLGGRYPLEDCPRADP